MQERITREELFVQMTLLISKRSTCPKKKVGAILIKDNRVIAMGYNGVLPNMDHSFGIDEDGVTHTVHAEANIISFCAKEGIPTKDTILMTSLSPCVKCAELIIQSGIKKVVFLESYRIDTGEMLIKNGIEVEYININDYEKP